MLLSTISRAIRTCTRCSLHSYRRKPVPGEGPSRARIMLVGEAPGREEDLQGRPFIGRSGRMLDKILQDAGLKRQAIFITSVVKCRPPRNRTPSKQEWTACIKAHLWRQIEEIDPQIICLLGGIATKALLDIERVSTVRGKVFQRAWAMLPTYHPAAALRNPAWHRALCRDIKKLQLLIQGK